MASPPRTERLKSLRLPTLVLHGSADTLIRPEAGRHTAECIAGSEYHEIEGWGHDMPLPGDPDRRRVDRAVCRKSGSEKKSRGLKRPRST